MSLNLKTLEKYYEDGLLYKQTHPLLPLTIWNYTEKVQYERLWDEVTIQCRGLITSGDKVIVRPFKKFFNYEELIGGDSIPSRGDYVYVQEKMDGSLGILFNFENEWIMATRGSFTSTQAVTGLEILKKKYNLDAFFKEYAYLVEIIYPENRIVVDYKGEKIIFLSAVLNESFKWDPTDEPELHWTTANSIFYGSGIKKSDIVKTEQHFSFSDELYKSLKDRNEENKEGYVLRYQPGNFRMKIKFEEYVRLHKIMTNLSTTAVWETLSNGDNMDLLLKDVPDEFYQKIKEYEKELLNSFQMLEREYRWIFKIINRVKGIEDRRVFAEYAKGYKHPSLLFSLLDGKDISPTIWKLIRPEFQKL
jgi:RNA ligase